MNKKQKKFESQYLEIINDIALPLALLKNNKYGDSWRELGIKGTFVDLHRKHARLKELIWNEKSDTPEETLKDTCLDMVNYSVMLTILVLEGNKE